MMARIISILLTCILSSNGFAENVLVKVGEGGVTGDQLEQALNAAPFATQFPSMDEKDQARLRGDMLVRLAQAEALYQEALDQGVHQEPVFLKEMANFRTTLLAQRYRNILRNEFRIPEEIEKSLSQKYEGNGDTLSASRSVYVANHFPGFKANRIEQLGRRFKVQVHTDRVKTGLSSDAALVDGDGFVVKAGDLMSESDLARIDKTMLQEKVDDWLEVILFAHAAEQEGIDIGGQLLDYRRRSLAKALLEKQEKKWVPNDETLSAYYQNNPKTGYVPERRQLGQLVVESASLAEQLRKRVLSGESLFELAAEYSIDPYGRQQAGDMGWLYEGTGMPEIEKTLKDLPDGEVSPVIRTGKGYHLVMILSRKPSEQRAFAAIKDRVKQALIAEKMSGYLKTVMARHPLEWKIPDQEHL